MRAAALLVASALLLAAGASEAQPYPARPVRLVVPLSPGGFADVPARMLLPRLSSALGRQVFVENRPGAGGTIGAHEVAKSAPDGHTLLVAATPHVISAHLYRSLPYDSLRDFAPVALLGSGPYALVVNPQRLAVSSVEELIAAARRHPGNIDYASSGNGSAQHLVGALFNAMAGTALNHVPYKGSGPAMQDLLGGQVAVSFAGIPNVAAAAKSGKLRVLAVTSRERWSEWPSVPTLAEAVRGYEATLWLGLVAPVATPAEIVARLHGEVAKALQDPEVQKNFRSAGVEAGILAPQPFGAYLHAEYEKWGRVVKDTGATVN